MINQHVASARSGISLVLAMIRAIRVFVTSLPCLTWGSKIHLAHTSGLHLLSLSTSYCTIDTFLHRYSHLGQGGVDSWFRCRFLRCRRHVLHRYRRAEHFSELVGASGRWNQFQGRFGRLGSIAGFGVLAG